MKSNISKVFFYVIGTSTAMLWLFDMITNAIYGDYRTAVLCFLIVLLITSFMVMSSTAFSLKKELEFQDQLIDELMEERRQKDGE